MIKKYITLVLLTFSVFPLSAQTVTCRDIFSQMPDSLLPYLTANNRLDMIDFMESKMKAVVQNRFDGRSEMLTLTDDSLTLKLSEALRLTIRLVDSQGEIDGSRRVIRVEEEVGIPSSLLANKCTFYSLTWRKLEEDELKLVK